MQVFKFNRKVARDNGEDGFESYKVRECLNHTSRKAWDRDVNAAINILNLYLLIREGKTMPIEFQRVPDLIAGRTDLKLRMAPGPVFERRTTTRVGWQYASES
jgi:hypothetical protein